jgi:hypothetical protein
MARDDALFWGGLLRDHLAGRRSDMTEEIEATPEEHVLQTDIGTWADALADSYAVEVPTLRRDATTGMSGGRTPMRRRSFGP